MGIGIHGEEGIKKEKIQSADIMAKEMVGRLLKEIPEGKKEYAPMVNGMGQTTEMELYLVNNFVTDYLKEDKSLDEVVKIAEEKMTYTKEIKALKGRASYVGERSIGHIDPGAYSSYLIIKKAFGGCDD